MSNVQNPGSALGEAIGAYMEIALNAFLEKYVQEFSCHFFHKGEKNPKTGKETKLLLKDKFGTAYNIDGVITDEAIKPLILIECKYIRYKKHNRDKGSWICTAHTNVRRTYNSIRSSIAVLAGSWSKSSVAMMTSHDVNVFIIPFEKITELLAIHNINFNWGEKERTIATESWEKYSELSYEQKLAIGEAMISVIAEDLKIVIQKTLDTTAERIIDKVLIEIKTNIGEVKIFEFPTIDDAMDFLEDFTIDEMLNHADSFSLFDQHYLRTNEDEDEDEE